MFHVQQKVLCLLHPENNFYNKSRGKIIAAAFVSRETALILKLLPSAEIPGSVFSCSSLHRANQW